MRAIERILPVLEPGKSVRIAVMPKGQDPDDILRHDGTEAFKAIINTAASLADALWERVAQQFNVDEPQAELPFFSSCAIWFARLDIIKRAKPMEMILNIAFNLCEIHYAPPLAHKAYLAPAEFIDLRQAQDADYLRC